MAKDNRTLGMFNLEGIPPARRGVPQIEVTFDIDANGILHVSAKDLGTGKEQKIRIESSSGLSDDEIKKMQEDAEKNAEADKKAREKVELRNQADQLALGLENALKESGDKVDAKEKKEAEEKIQAVKDAIKTDDENKIKASMDELQKVSNKIASKLYPQGGQQAGAQANPNAAGAKPEDKKEEKVVDAEVVDDDK